MATSIALNIITGRTGTAHISSDDDAAIWRGLVGNDNITLYTDQQLALDYQTKGRLSLSDGVFCIAGKMGRVSNASYVEYGLPSPGSCRRTFLLVRYAIDNNGIESMSLLTLQSEDATGSDAATTAATLPIDVDDETDYVLYDFVCDEDGVVSGTMKTKLTVMDTVPAIRAALNAESEARTQADLTIGNRVTALETFKTTEESARESADTALGNRITTLETWKAAENASTYKLVRVDGPSNTGYGHQYVICKIGVTSSHVMAYGEGGQFYKFTVNLNNTGTAATVSFTGLSGGSATVLGSVKFVSA